MNILNESELPKWTWSWRRHVSRPSPKSWIQNCEDIHLYERIRARTHFYTNSQLKNSRNQESKNSKSYVSTRWEKRQNSTTQYTPGHITQSTTRTKPAYKVNHHSICSWSAHYHHVLYSRYRPRLLSSVVQPTGFPLFLLSFLLWFFMLPQIQQGSRSCACKSDRNIDLIFVIMLYCHQELSIYWFFSSTPSSPTTGMYSR